MQRVNDLLLSKILLGGELRYIRPGSKKDCSGNAAPRDGVTAIEYGGARYPQATDISPLKRLNLALRYFVHGGYDKAFNKKPTIVEGLSKEIMLAAENSSESFAIQKRNDVEKQADAAR